MPDPVRLDTRVRTGADPDAVYDAFTGWVADQGLDLYPHQDEAVIELLGHASVTTTQVYTLVTVDNLREVFATSHPRAR